MAVDPGIYVREKEALIRVPNAINSVTDKLFMTVLMNTARGVWTLFMVGLTQHRQNGSARSSFECEMCIQKFPTTPECLQRGGK
jgi:hypothetical protein